MICFILLIFYFFVRGESFVVGVVVLAGWLLAEVLAVEVFVGPLEEVVDGGEHDAEEQCRAETVDIEAFDQSRCHEDDDGVDDKKEETEGDGGDGDGDDDEDGTEEVVEYGDDDGGE